MTASHRGIGTLPTLMVSVQRARAALSSVPMVQRKPFDELCQAFEDIARQQEEFNKRVWDSRESLPATHGDTHLGGNDSIVGQGLPSAITIGASGNRGTPQNGLAPHNHVHDSTSLSSLEGLTGVDTDALYGAAVYDTLVRRELEGISVELAQIKTLIEEWIDDWNTPKVRWDDLRFPATGINPTGPVSPPSVDATDGALLFASGSTNLISCIAQLPHGWIPGTTLHPHIHWEKTTSASGTVAWQMRYRYSSIGKVATAYTSYLDSELRVSDLDTAELHAYSEWAPMAVDRVTGVSAVYRINVQRVGASDTYGANAKLMEFDIHHRLDSLGSPAEYGP